MDHQALPDPSDWQGTELASLESLDSFLHCQICKDFYTSAVITTCSHTFCSLCIRRCLAAEGRCPSCRASEQESRLRKNTTVQEITDSFVTARGGILGFARQESQRLYDKEQESYHDQSRKERRVERGSKRKRGPDGHTNDAQAMSTEPRTRSQKKAASQSSTPNSAPSTSQNDGAIVVDSDQNEEEYLPDAAIQEQPPRKSPQGKAEDGLVACPICGRRMKEEFVFPHTDTCTGAASPSTQQSSERTGSSRPAPPMSQQLRRQNETPPLERLPQITYSIFRDQALRKKLSELGIPSWGSRQLLIKRHSEWLALWNANCDSTRPRPKATLMSDLEKWERSQGGHAPQGGASVFGCSANGGSGTGFTAASVMQKGFDGNEWAQSHQDDFKSLIAKAREKRNATASIKSDENANGKEEPTTAEAIDGREISQTGTSLVSDLKNNEAQIKPSKPPEMLPESRRNDQGPGEGDAPTDVAQPGYPSALKEAREAHAMGPREEEICERLNGPNEAINDSMPNQMLSLSNGPESEGAMREDGCVNEARRRKQPMFAAPS